MNKAIKQRASYIVQTMVGKDTSEEYPMVIKYVVKAAHCIKAKYWIFKVNNMREGEILAMYYFLTDRR